MLSLCGIPFLLHLLIQILLIQNYFLLKRELKRLIKQQFREEWKKKNFRITEQRMSQALQVWRFILDSSRTEHLQVATCNRSMSDSQKLKIFEWLN